jgi:ATP synthase protein I
VAKPARPGEPGQAGAERGLSGAGDGDLDRRRRELEAALAAKRPAETGQAGGSNASRSGYAQAVKLSSEFVAGIAVGVGLGWAVDRFAGTSPWGLIVGLLLGFAAGVLNVMRSVGAIAEAGIRAPDSGDRRREEK